MHKNIHWIFGSKYNPTKSDFTYHHRYETHSNPLTHSYTHTNISSIFCKQPSPPSATPPHFPT